MAGWQLLSADVAVTFIITWTMGLTSLYDVWSVVADTWTWMREAGLYSQLR